MTTIAFKDGVVAADTMISEDGFASSGITKIHRFGPWIIGGCGNLHEVERFRDWVRKGMPGDLPLEDDSNSEMFMILPEGGFLCFLHKGIIIRQHAAYYAWGSGRRFAIGAMAAGASPEQAILIAAQHDNVTGLPLPMTVLRLDTPQ